MIRAAGLSRKYGASSAVEDVSFQISPGEVVGVLGQSGSGKSTILKMLTGLLEPSAGRIEVDGHHFPEHRKEIQRRIGYLPESCPLDAEMTVIECLECMAALRDLPRGEQPSAVRAALVQTELIDKASHPIYTLSERYRLQVGVARAILGRPKILILDEPANGTGPMQLQLIRALIPQLARRMTVVLSTRRPEAVQTLCDRVLIIVDGRLRLDSRLEDLQSSHRLLVSIDVGPEHSKEKLSALGGVRRFQFLRSDGIRHEYALEVKRNASADGLAETTAGIAGALVMQGVKLFAIHPQRRELGTAFQELNQRS